MYNLLSLLVGGVISVMVFLNGKLTAGYGVYAASVWIHIVGVAFAGVLCLIKKANVAGRAPWWAYLGGAIGVLTTLFNNFAFGHISMTSIVALGLLGQSLTALTLDSFGWLGAQKRRAGRYALVGYLAALIGIFVMLDRSVSDAAAAVAVSLGAGVTVVLSRTINARLAALTSPIAGSWINHLVGLPICILLALFLQPSGLPDAVGGSPLIYCGGVLGVVTVLLFNITVPKVSAFRLTLLSFIGQIFTGIALDIAVGTAFSASTFAGGVIIAGGLLTNLLLEQWNRRRTPGQKM